ncbi:MAG: 2-amino-4-hydroxy-6-hydroxymethyldihydropteridine diphosphokinase [Chloroflexota bacterium]
MDNHTVYLALGSNLGDRAANLKTALGLLAPQMTVLAKSPVYETPPWGHTDQPDFLNQVVKVETHLQPLPLLKHLKRLEVAMGRQPTFPKGPRLIDLDILFYDDVVLRDFEISIPHPGVHERAFVLVPLNDIAPDLIHPVNGSTVREMLSAVDASGVRIFSA